MIQLALRKITRILRSRNAFVPLLLILIASSAAFTVTFSLLFSIQGAGSNALGESNHLVIVSSGNSRTPVTSVIPLALIGKISQVSGIRNISPEVLAPSTLSNKPVMVLGVDPAIFYQIDNPKILYGNLLQRNGTTQVMIGSLLATELQITVGNKLVLVGALYPTIVDVTVIGIFHTGTTIDNEIVAPLWVGQWLRGLGYGMVSIFRLQVRQGQSVSQITQELQNTIKTAKSENNNLSTILPYLPYSYSSTNFGNISLNISSNTSQEFLSRAFGLSQESILFLSALVFISLVVAIVFAYQELIFGSKVELGTLKVLGMSSRSLSKDLILTAMIFAVIAAVIGWALGFIMLSFIPNLNPLVLAFYSIHPLSSVVIALIGTTVIAALIAALAGTFSSYQFNRISEPEPMESQI